MSIEEHQALIQHIELIVARAGTCTNPIDRELHTKTIVYLDELQQLTSKGLK